MAQYWQKWSDAIHRVADARKREEVDERTRVAQKAAKELMEFAASTAGQMAKMLLAAANEKITIAISDTSEVYTEYALTQEGFMVRRAGVVGNWCGLESLASFQSMLYASISLNGMEFLKDPVAALRAQLDRIADDLQRKYAKL